MTENEVIAKFKRTSVFWESATNTEMVEAVKVAIQALEEIQQYRVYIEIFENHFCKEALELLSDKEEFGKWLERGKWIAKRCDEINRELVEYQTIGTIEEFKALKEKNEPKKAKWHPNPCAEDNRIPICPNCNTIMVRTEIFGRTIDEHCVSCGQAIDWSE